MNLLHSVRAVTGASGTGQVDWEAVAAAAKAATEPGSVDLSPGEREGYAADARDARDRLRTVAGVDFDLPPAVEVQHRHHWIDANVRTIRRVVRPLEERGPATVPGVARVANTGSLSVALAFLARHVLGQYDPRLLADGSEDPGLYFVDPNIRATATELGVEYPRFRRWIAFHEVAHAAEFGAAPWLGDHIERRIERALAAFADGRFDRGAVRDLDTAMTAVEGYAELLMDRAFDAEYADLRAKVDARRRGGDVLTRLLKRALGLGLKRRQYERGAAFFRAVADARGVEAAARAWERPENLPTDAELDAPERWLARVS
ncbi:MAG: zinc-dependent metalloprotease [Haloferacaceae archaeon]